MIYTPTILLCLAVILISGFDIARASQHARGLRGRKLQYNSDPSEDNVYSPPAVPFTNAPTISPSSVPPSNAPTVSPTAAPSPLPTATPSLSPSWSPTLAPSASPTLFPMTLPTKSPAVVTREDAVPPDGSDSPTPCPLRRRHDDETHCFLWIFCF